MARKFTLKSSSAVESIDFSAELNRQQLAAATAPGGPMLVVAGPGSGKTGALTYRLAWLVHNGIDAPAETIDTVLNEFYDDYLVSHYDGAELRREDIRGLANYAAQYRTREAFLADVALAGEFSGETCVTGPTEQDFVTLSTIHQAKGLEWAVVFIPWLADGRFPTDLAINTTDELEEERRVFHVALTRAKDELYLVVPQVYRNRGGGLVMMKPSRFLTEVAAELTEPMELEQGLPGLIGGESAAEMKLPGP